MSAPSAFHPIYLRLLGGLLQRRGIDSALLLAQARLPAATLQDSADQSLDFNRVQALLLAAQDLTGCPWIGLELGAATQLHTHGVVGQAVVSSPDLGQALRTLCRFAGLRTAALQFSLVVQDEQTRLQIRLRFELGAVHVCIGEAVLVILDRLIMSLSGQPLSASRCRVPWPAPAWSDRYAEVLQGEVEFSAAELELSFPAELLEWPCLTADALAHGQAVQDCERRLAERDSHSPLVDRIRRHLAACPQHFPSAAELAASLHVSTRSLFRQLQLGQTSYQSLLDEIRRERAQWHLQHGLEPIAVIAERLGYVDGSNFSRAFKRWFGQTPAQYRARTAR